MHVEAGGSLADLWAPYQSAYSADVAQAPFDAFFLLFLFAPVALAPLAHCLIPDRRRQPVSALTVIAVPLYLALGRALFGWTIDAWAPAVVLLACFGAWLSVSRLRALMRGFAIGLSLISAASSWAFIGRWDSDWKQALFGTDMTSRAVASCAPGQTPRSNCDGLRGRLEDDAQ
jgi:hypothetical protein